MDPRDQPDPQGLHGGHGDRVPSRDAHRASATRSSATSAWNSVRIRTCGARGPLPGRSRRDRQLRGHPPGSDRGPGADPRFQASSVGFGRTFDAVESQATTINQRFSSLEAGAEPNTVNDHGQTLLHRGQRTRSSRPRSSQRNRTRTPWENNGYAPLHYAGAQSGNRRVGTLLLAARAATRVESKDGRTPLHSARPSAVIRGVASVPIQAAAAGNLTLRQIEPSHVGQQPSVDCPIKSNACRRGAMSALKGLTDHLCRGSRGRVTKLMLSVKMRTKRRFSHGQSE